MNLDKPRLYLETARHLRAGQVLNRVLRKVRRPRLRLLSGRWRGLPGNFSEAPAREQSQFGPHQFRFLNAEADLVPGMRWENAHPDKLWRYNLHYFDDLNARGGTERSLWHRDLIQKWMKDNPPGVGEGWEPYPLSLRIVNWAKWLGRGNVPPEGMIDSLATQAAWLFRTIEYHLLGNHLLANAKALAFAAEVIDCDERDKWYRASRRLLEQELAEQVLADGGHFERSPMYHAIVLEDVLDLIPIYESAGRDDDAFAAQLKDRARHMLDWLGAMIHPDGGIAFFNDAANGIAPTYLQLRTYAAARGVPAGKVATPVHHLSESGYVRAELGPCVALIDCAPIGPDYLPGHAHADTLSFEASILGQRVIVNGGTSQYGSGERRQFERGTAAHSTVEVGGQDSSEVWAGFRVARRARPLAVRVERQAWSVEVAGSHDGYRRLSGAPVHSRRWRLERDRLIVEDRVVTRDGTVPMAVAHFHLHPDVRCDRVADDRFRLTLPGALTCEMQILGGQARVAVSQYAPEFGVIRQSQQIVLQLAKGAASVILVWPTVASAGVDVAST